MCRCSIVSVGGDGMFAEIVHGLLTNVLKASGSDQPSVDTVLPQPKWRIGIIPTGTCVILVSKFILVVVFATFLPPANVVDDALSHVCLSVCVCLSCMCSNFCETLPRNFVFRMNLI